MINRCLDAGVNLFDTADAYSDGLSEKILGKAMEGLRNKLLISTKATFNLNPESRNAMGSSRFHLIEACEASLKRLNTDHIDIYHMHGFDANTPVEETLRALDDLITAGKIRYIACSNFSGWHLMKALSVSERYGWNRYVAQQVHYSLLNREFEWELMPLGIDQKVGSIIWSPLSAGRLGGRYRRNNPIPADGRVARGGSPIPDEATSYERLYNIMDVLDEIAEETGHTVAQCALNWLLQRPTVSSLIIGASTEEQLKQNLEAVGWNLTPEQVKRLDDASQVTPVYPYWHQAQFPFLNAQIQF
ncbi:aldo/keto reductase [Parabacteroides faecis]|nr:aldo/keto reductase [Parabacteroides faecis]UVQ48811.1 aldo/keto reductase [Parabacteroides faecis]